MIVLTKYEHPCAPLLVLIRSKILELSIKRAKDNGRENLCKNGKEEGNRRKKYEKKRKGKGKETQKRKKKEMNKTYYSI